MQLESYMEVHEMSSRTSRLLTMRRAKQQSDRESHPRERSFCDIVARGPAQLAASTTHPLPPLHFPPALPAAANTRYKLRKYDGRRSAAGLTLVRPTTHPSGSQPPASARFVSKKVADAVTDVTDEASSTAARTDDSSSTAGATNEGTGTAFIPSIAVVDLAGHDPASLCVGEARREQRLSGLFNQLGTLQSTNQMTDYQIPRHPGPLYRVR